MSAIQLRFERGGVHLPRLGLWLDPHSARRGPERVFISHAHSDHIGRHRETILTAPTARLMRARLGGERREHTPAIGEPLRFDDAEIPFQITLLPAGHIFGSAMAFIEADGESLLYTGDFKLRRGLVAEPCAPRRADVLVMETTFGRPRYVFPPAAQVWAEVLAFCHAALAAEEIPVLLGYSLGKAQELLRGLTGAGLPVMVHPAIGELTRIHEEFGLRFGAYEEFAPAAAKGKVLLFPPGAKLPALGRVRRAVATGWAVETSCRFRHGVDAAFTLSDHADFPELVEFVRQVAPRQVGTLHGFAADFAQSLRDLGYDARALSEADQLHLALGV